MWYHIIEKVYVFEIGADIMYKNIEMSAYSSMKTGGIAPECYFPETEQELCGIIDLLEEQNKHYYVFGNMSNVLIPDGTLDFVPVITTKMNLWQVTEKENGEISVYALCGASLTRLAYDMCKNGYGDMTFAYGIPGTVGGAVFMNAGAYGGEICQVTKYVMCYDKKARKTIRVEGADCGFGYRTSAFQKNGLIILGAGLTLKKGNAEELTATAKQTMQKRVDKQPLEYPSCGSAFKRPEGYFAGELIEKSGLKGYSVGGACVSEKHAGFIINKGGATTGDVLGLIKEVQDKVKENFGVELEPEIQLVK